MQNAKNYRPCLICKGEHSIYFCDQFLKLAPQDRLNEIKKICLCVNCLRGNHRPFECCLRGCRQCNKRHNSVLHFKQKKEESVQKASNPIASTSNYHIRIKTEVYLATAVVDIREDNGNFQPCRIMLDEGAQSCTITNSCASRLGLKKTPVEIPLLSLDHIQTNIKFATSATLKSRFDHKKRNLDLLIVNEIAEAMPTMPLDRNYFEIPPNIFLADPIFHEPALADMNIGAELAYAFFCTGQLRIKRHTAILQKTVLGRIIAGRVYGKNHILNYRATKIFSLFKQFDKLPILWELDQVQTTSLHSPEEQACEAHFANHVRRDNSGL